LCNSAQHGLPPICQIDADCAASGGRTHCIFAKEADCGEDCSGGTSCAYACIPCPTGERLCGDSCCPNGRDCCRGVCCAANEQCRGPVTNRQCVVV
jgi:hypothetical protein